MANTRGTLTGHRKESDTGTASRLGSEAVSAKLATWTTEVRATMRKDNSGEASLGKIDGFCMACMSWKPDPDDPSRFLVTFEHRDDGGHMHRTGYSLSA